MPKISAGILMYRIRGGKTEVFLVHPGGPFWAKKDDGAWSIPKGLCEPGEDMLAAAVREFEEETGFRVDGEFVPLGELKQPSGKVIHTWAVEGDCEPAKLVSNMFEMEWPPRSGKMREFPEIDRGGWFGLDDAMRKIVKGQAAFITRLLETLGGIRVIPAC